MSETQNQFSLTRAALSTCGRAKGNFHQSLNCSGYLRSRIIGLCASNAIGCKGSSGSSIGLSAILANSRVGSSESVTGKCNTP
jgi:hypothetical protein